MQFQYFDTVHQAQRGYSRVMEPICRQWELTRNELDVLLFLANNPGQDRAVDIVNGRGMTKSHVSLSVTDLEARGLLVRREDPADRRTVRLALTEGADEIIRAGREAQKGFFSRIFEGVSREEMDALREITGKICENIEKLEKK